MLLHFIIFTTPTERPNERTNRMSGNAALSAARKRRASSSPMGAGAGAGGMSNSSASQSSAYYNRTTPTAQQLMNQTFPEHNNTPQFQGPRESAPNVPINIYENIELIRQQITARTKAIQTQGNAIPVDKLRILQKQNEIQTQILKQKMAIAQQMELAEEGQQQKQQQQHQQQAQMAMPSMNEPEFIYEKGIPRKNPKYKTPAEIEAMKQARAQVKAQARAPAQAQAQSQAPARGPANNQMTPFVSMITETGVFPPPIVILKSHDAKLEEHDNVIHDMIQQLDYLHSRIEHSSSSSSSSSLPAIKEDTHKGEAGADADADEEPEQELLMEVVMNDLTNSREFVEGIVDKIVNDTNLSDVIMKIEPLVKENQELRSLIHSQQQMLNEMNTMLLRLLNTNGPTCSSSSSAVASSPEPIVFQDNGLDCDGLYESEMTEIMLSNSSEVVVIDDPDTVSAQIIDAADEVAEVVEVAEVADEVVEEVVEVADAAVEVAEVAEVADADEADEEESPAELSEMPHFPEPITLLINEI